MKVPQVDELVAAIHVMCDNLGCSHLSPDQCHRLIRYDLYDGELNGDDGKEGWQCLLDGLITERELRMLMMEHTTWKVCTWAGIDLPYDARTYIDEALCLQFENALYGRAAKIAPIETPERQKAFDEWLRSDKKTLRY